MKKKYWYTLGLMSLLLAGCNTQEPAEAPIASSSSRSSASSSTQESISVSTSEITESSTTLESSNEPLQTNSTDSHYALVIEDFKSKLYGEWTYTNSLASGIDFYREISEIRFSEDGTFSLKMSSNKDDVNGVIFESSGTYQISENGVKQTLEGFSHYVDNYDDFATQDTGFRANYIQVRFTSSDNEVTTGIYILANGHLTFENPHLLFNENVTGLAEFEKF